MDEQKTLTLDFIKSLMDHAIISNVSNQAQSLFKGARIGQLVITPTVIADFVTDLG